MVARAAARNLVVKVMGWGNKEGGAARVSGIGNRGCGILRSKSRIPTFTASLVIKSVGVEHNYSNSTQILLTPALVT